MEHDSPVTQAIEKVDTACPYEGCGVKGGHTITDCIWHIHRLARELAKVAQIEAGDSITTGLAIVLVKHGYGAGSPLAKDIDKMVKAALPLEAIDD